MRHERQNWLTDDADLESDANDLEPYPDAPAVPHPPRRADGKPLDGDEVVAWVRERTDTIMLGMSTGKDSLATYARCRDVFGTVVLYHCYAVPGLAFVERTLRYYEAEFGTHIWRLPHPALMRWLSSGLFQPPERSAILEAASIPLVPYEDMYVILAEQAGIEGTEWWVATGVRAADSPMRRIALSQHGGINVTSRVFHPIWDWRKDRTAQAIDSLGVALPVDYHLFGRSFDGVDHRFLAPLREHFPDDYARLIEWFPLADLEFYRRGDRSVDQPL